MKKLFKTTIVIWSDYNPEAEEVELSQLAENATSGDAYCAKMVTEEVAVPEKDKDWDGTEFFGDMEKEAE